VAGCLPRSLAAALWVLSSPPRAPPRLQGCLVKAHGSHEAIGLPACSGVKVGGAAASGLQRGLVPPSLFQSMHPTVNLPRSCHKICLQPPPPPTPHPPWAGG
jgi:hypothetical protein